MKVSELRSALEHIEKSVGDLPVSVTLSVNGLVRGENLFIDVQTMEGDDGKPFEEVNIRDFPY